MSTKVVPVMSRRFFPVLCIMGFFAILSSTMSKSPVLPSFAESLGTPEYLLGFVASASTIPGIIASLPAGSLSDRQGRGKVILLAGVIFATAPFLYLLVVNPYQLILVRFYHGFATAILVPVANAAIVERFPESRGQRVSTFSSSTAVGRAIAPALGGYILLVTVSNYHELYIIVGIAGALALFMATGLREKRETVEGLDAEAPTDGGTLGKAASKSGRGSVRDWGEVASDGRVVAGGLVEAAQYYTYGAFEFYLVGYALSLNPPVDSFLVGIILAAAIVTLVIGKPIMGGVSDRIGRRRPIVLGLVLGGVSMIAVQFATSFFQLVVVSVTYGLGFSLVTSSTPPLVSELVRKEVYGSAMGFLGTIMDVGQVLGPIVTGFILAAGFGYSGSFTSLGILLLSAALLFSVWLKRSHSRDDRGTSSSESLSGGIPRG